MLTYINNIKKYVHISADFSDIVVTGTVNVRVSYVYTDAQMWAKDVSNQGKGHVLISTTIEEDKAKNNDTMNIEDNWKYNRDVATEMNNVDIDFSDPNKYRTCSYLLPDDLRKKGYGYSEVSLFIGPNKKTGVTGIYAGVHMIDGKVTSGNNEFKEEDIADPNSIKSTIKQNLSCPYYVYYNNEGTNKVTILNDRTGYDTQYVANGNKSAFLLISSTIASEKPSHSAERDLVPGTAEFEQDKALQRARELGWLTNSGDDDPFAYRKGVIGDKFCEQPETIKASRLLGFFVILVKVLVPMIIIIWGILDFAKVVTQGTTDSLKKEAITFGIRVLLGIFIFFVPSIISAAFDAFMYFKSAGQEYNKCAQCIFHPFDDSKCKVDDSTAYPTTTTAAAGNSIKGPLTQQVTQKLSPGIILSDPDNN